MHHRLSFDEVMSSWSYIPQRNRGICLITESISHQKLSMVYHFHMFLSELFSYFTSSRRMWAMCVNVNKW